MTLSTQHYVLVVLVLSMVTAGTCSKMQNDRLRAQVLDLELQVDSISGERLAVTLQLDGWQTEFGSVSPDSARAVIAANNERLLAQIDSADLRARFFARANTRLETELSSVGTPAPIQPGQQPELVPVQWTGETFTGPIHSQWVADRTGQELTLTERFFAEFALNIVGIDAGEEMVFGIENANPYEGITIEVEDYVYVKPAVPPCPSCDRAWWDRWWIEIPLAGAAGWFLHEALDDVQIEYVR